MRSGGLVKSVFGEKRNDRFEHSRREVVSRLGRDDSRAARFCIAKKRRTDPASPPLAIDGQDAKVLAAGHRDAFEIAEDARPRLSLVSRSEALFLRDALELVRNIVRPRKQLTNLRQIPAGKISNHTAIMASLSH